MSWIDILTIVVALGAATMGGTFFAFSNFVMPALKLQPPIAGILAMRSINVRVLNPVFLGTLMGTALLGLVLVVGVFLEKGSLWAAAGALLYIVGLLGVTMSRNVPMNERLKSVNELSTEGVAYWGYYLTEWTRWNRLRGLAGLLATVLLMLALVS